MARKAGEYWIRLSFSADASALAPCLARIGGRLRSSVTPSTRAALTGVPLAKQFHIHELLTRVDPELRLVSARPRHAYAYTVGLEQVVEGSFTWATAPSRMWGWTWCTFAATTIPAASRRLLCGSPRLPPSRPLVAL